MHALTDRYYKLVTLQPTQQCRVVHPSHSLTGTRSDCIVIDPAIPHLSIYTDTGADARATTRSAHQIFRDYKLREEEEVEKEEEDDADADADDDDDDDDDEDKVVSDKEVNRKLYGLPLSIWYCPGLTGRRVPLSMRRAKKGFWIITPTHGRQFNLIATARKINHLATREMYLLRVARSEIDFLDCSEGRCRLNAAGNHKPNDEAI
ncbi:hypothetical protein V1477_001788 [Vespula maculifrons]|uniref:Uncharacterized protein n=1 Tax=Vespula maculifrons TaxID=7453 RepID=A0ABD2CXC0_VESMC